jgi:hypothetical protein
MADPMRDQFANAQQIRKVAVVSKGGFVVAQSRRAAEVGACGFREPGPSGYAKISPTAQGTAGRFGQKLIG